MSWPLIIGSAMNYANQFGSAAINMQQQDRQNAFNFRMWERNNQYNDPSAQLARLLAAGVPYNTAIQAIAGGTVGQQTSDSPAQSASYTPMQPVSLSDSVSLQQSYDAHTLSNAEAMLKRAEAMKISQDISHDSDYHPYRLQGYMADSARKFFENNVAYETYGDTLFKARSDASGSYYNALNAAFDAWEKGYLPDGLTLDDISKMKENGQFNAYVGDKQFANEFFYNINQAHNAIQAAADEYELTSYDVQYLRELFRDMVSYDQEKFAIDLERMRSHSKVFSAMSDHEWLQFLDYFIDKFGGFAVSAGSAFANFRGYRHK